jgi:hypothetical protein
MLVIVRASALSIIYIIKASPVRNEIQSCSNESLFDHDAEVVNG